MIIRNKKYTLKNMLGPNEAKIMKPQQQDVIRRGFTESTTDKLIVKLISWELKKKKWFPKNCASKLQNTSMVTFMN